MVIKGTKKKSTPKSMEAGIDSLGKFRKARTITSNGRGIRTRGPVRGGR